MYNFDNDIDDSGYFINFSIYRISYLQDKTRYYYVGDKCHNETEIKNMAHQLMCKEKNFEDFKLNDIEEVKELTEKEVERELEDAPLFLLKEEINNNEPEVLDLLEEINKNKKPNKENENKVYRCDIKHKNISAILDYLQEYKAYLLELQKLIKYKTFKTFENFVDFLQAKRKDILEICKTDTYLWYKFIKLYDGIKVKDLQYFSTTISFYKFIKSYNDMKVHDLKEYYTLSNKKYYSLINVVDIDMFDERNQERVIYYDIDTSNVFKN